MLKLIYGVRQPERAEKLCENEVAGLKRGMEGLSAKWSSFSGKEYWDKELVCKS